MNYYTLKQLKPSEIETLENEVRALGCIICHSPALLHHCKKNPTFPDKRKHRPFIPLCLFHHQFHGVGNSFHDGQETWEELHGTQEKLLLRVFKLLGFESWPF